MAVCYGDIDFVNLSKSSMNSDYEPHYSSLFTSSLFIDLGLKSLLRLFSDQSHLIQIILEEHSFCPRRATYAAN